MGEIDTVQSLLANQVHEVKVIDGWETKNYVETITKDTPDHILIQAKLENGPVLSMNVRAGRPAPFEPKFLWRIYGTRGEIDIGADGMLLNVKTSGITIRIYDHESQKVEEVPVDKDGFEDLPGQAQNIGRVYEAFATGDENKVLVTFEDAFKRHVLIQKMLEHWDEGDQGWKL